MENNKDIKKTKQVFKQLRDLTIEDVKELTKLQVIFVRNPRNVRPGMVALNDSVSINVKIHDDFLKAVAIRPGGEFLTIDRFELIQTAVNLPSVDDNGRPIRTWVRNVPVRFVRGRYEDDTEYLSLELIFKQFVYDTHFFTSDQRRIIEMKEAQGIKLPWIERPDKIVKASAIEDVDFI